MVCLKTMTRQTRRVLREEFRPAIGVGLFVAFGGVLFGYDTGTIGGILAMPFWLQEFSTPGNHGEITPSQDALIVSILSAGTFFGALLAAPTADFLGRRWGLMFSAGIVFNLGVILQTAATEQPMFIAGRFFAGLGVGLISAMSESFKFRGRIPILIDRSSHVSI